MKIMAAAVVVAAGSILLAAGETLRANSARCDAGSTAITGGIVVTAVGLCLVLLEFDPLPVRWLREWWQEPIRRQDP